MNAGRRAICGDEQDVITGWRKKLCYCARPGVTSSIKRKMRRRERQEAKREIRNEEV